MRKPAYQRDWGGHGHGKARGRTFIVNKESIVTFRCTHGCPGYWKEPLRALDRASAQMCKKCGALGRETDASAKRRSPRAPRKNKETAAKQARWDKPFACQCGSRFRATAALSLHVTEQGHTVAPPRHRVEKLGWMKAGLSWDYAKRRPRGYPFS